MNEPITRPVDLARRLMRICLVALVFGPVHAHDGHDQAPAARTAARGLAPRLAAASPDLELLAVWQPGKLLIYLDRYATNEPVSGASIELESGTNRASAAPAGEGLYQTAAPWLANPGKHPLVFTVQAREVTDLLNATLDIPETAAAVSAHGHESDAREHWTRRGIWELAAASLALLLATIWAARRRIRERQA